MLVSRVKQVFSLFVVSLMSACASYVPHNLQRSDIAASDKIDSYIESIIVEPSFKRPGGLIQGIKESEKVQIDKDNRILFVEERSEAFSDVYTNWQTILEKIVSDFGLFNKNSKNIHALRVSVLDIRFPNMGGVFPTDITAHYEIIDTFSSKVVFSREIKSHAQAEIQYFAGAHRSRDAFERAVNRNIKTFIEELLKI